LPRKGINLTISNEVLESWVTELLVAWKYSPENAAFLANTLTDANLRGVDSHGVVRLAAYEKRIDQGLADPAAVPIVSGSGSALKVNANGAAGQIASLKAAQVVLEAALENGVAAVSVFGSTHFGTAGYYARWLASKGVIGIVVSNSEPIVVPFGGRSPLFGTNPLAFAAPTSGELLSIDMATSTSAMGKVILARQESKTVPADWGIDENGEPSTDPNAIVSLLPAGGPKGYALGFLVEILGGVLTGAAVTHSIGNMYSDFDKPQDVGHFMIAIDINRFIPYEDFISRMDSLVDQARAVEPAPGFQKVLAPGDPEQMVASTRLKEGIPLAAATIEELRQLGMKAGVPFPEMSQ
jgi:LDH2 family malate/lactate/ureidoglycolate dehydrogenase